jgi:hypothetical protein
MWATFELYQRKYPTGQRGKTGDTKKTHSSPHERGHALCATRAPSVTQGSPWTRFATHQRPPLSHGGGNRGARHAALNAGYNLAQLATSCIGIGSGAAVQRTAGASPRAEGAAFGPGNWLQRDSSAGRLLLSTSSDRPTSLSTQPCM